MNRAALLMKELLSVEDKTSTEMYKAFEEAGIGKRTAERTKKEIGIHSYRKNNQWYLSLKRD